MIFRYVVESKTWKVLPIGRRRPVSDHKYIFYGFPAIINGMRTLKSLFCNKLLICKEYYVGATLLWNEQIAKVVRQQDDYQCTGIKWAGGNSSNMYIMTPSNGYIFCVNVPLCGESTGHPYKGTVIWTIDVSLLLVWINCSTNTRIFVCEMTCSKINRMLGPILIIKTVSPGV